MNHPTGTHAKQVEHEAVLDPGAVRAAIARGELEVWYQPQLELVSGGLERFEALVRWRHPRLGMLLPGQFIPAAEAMSEMDDLGEFVMTQAVRQVASWSRLAPDSGIGVSINLSSAQALDTRLPALVERALADNSVPAHLLTVELAEPVLMTPGVEAVIRGLQSLGVELAVDNFGTGFSSLSRLRRLGINYLKIARPLVAGLGHDPDDTLVVEAVVQMAHTLQMKAVAEGVETLDQLGRLSDLGCDFAQGFYWSKAMLSADADRMVSRALVRLA